MNSVNQYKQDEKNNITRRLVNKTLEYKAPFCEEIQAKAVDLLTEIDDMVVVLAEKYNTNESGIKCIITHLYLDSMVTS